MNDAIDELWHPSSYPSSYSSLVDHWDRHGLEVGAEDLDQYLKKALGFKQNLRRAQRSRPEGPTEGVIRYTKNSRYIDIAPDGRIISFGSE